MYFQNYERWELSIDQPLFIRNLFIWNRVNKQSLNFESHLLWSLSKDAISRWRGWIYHGRLSYSQRHPILWQFFSHDSFWQIGSKILHHSEYESGKHFVSRHLSGCPCSLWSLIDLSELCVHTRNYSHEVLGTSSKKCKILIWSGI